MNLTEGLKARKAMEELIKTLPNTRPHENSHFTYVKRVEIGKQPSRDIWLLKCDCGVLRRKPYNYTLRSEAVSCGCVSRKKRKENKLSHVIIAKPDDPTSKARLKQWEENRVRPESLDNWLPNY